MTTTVLMKPSSTVTFLDSSSYTAVGATFPVALNDNSDSTYVYKNTSALPQPRTLGQYVDTSGKRDDLTFHRTRAAVRISFNSPGGSVNIKYFYSTGDDASSLYKKFTITQLAPGSWSILGPYSSAVPDNYPHSVGGDSLLASVYAIADSMPNYGGPSSATRIIQGWFEVEYVTPPTVTILAPTGTIVNTTTPTVAWTHNSTEGFQQTKYYVAIYPSSVYSAPGFNVGMPAFPNQSFPRAPNAHGIVAGQPTGIAPGAVYDSGVVVSTVNSIVPFISLSKTSTYRVYVWTGEYTGVITSWSLPSFSTFTTNVTGSPAPSLTATWIPASQAVQLAAVGHANMLTMNQGDLETDLTGWVALSNCTIARTTAQFQIGAASMSVSGTASGDYIASTSTGISGVPVNPGTTYSAVLASKSASVTATLVRAEIAWYDASGTLLSTSRGTAANDVTSGWTTHSVVDVSPLLAQYAAVRFFVLTSTLHEVHFVDAISLFPGVVQGSSPNLCLNPSFEGDVSHYQTSVISYDTGTLVQSSAIGALFGTKEALFTFPASVSGASGFCYNTNGVTLIPGATYTFSIYVYVPSGNPDIKAEVPFGASGTTTTTKDAWSRVSVTFVATTGDMVMGVRNAAGAGGVYTAGKIFYADGAQLELGSTPTTFSIPSAPWSPGADPGSELDLILERSYDGGATWMPVRHLAGDVDSTVNSWWLDPPNRTEGYNGYDYEARRSYTVKYRAATIRINTTTGESLVGDYANVDCVTVSDGNWWLKVISDPTKNYGPACVTGPINSAKSESQNVDYPLGRDRPVIEHGDLYGWDGGYGFATPDAVAWKKLRDVLNRQDTVLVQSPWLDESGAGYQKYVEWTSRSESIVGPPRAPIRTASADYLNVSGDILADPVVS